jgi:hypothetical protein
MQGITPERTETAGKFMAGLHENMPKSENFPVNSLTNRE